MAFRTEFYWMNPEIISLSTIKVQATVQATAQAQTVAAQSYDRFLNILIQRYPKRAIDLIYEVVLDYPTMTLSEKLQQLDQLKGWLDSFRPLSAEILSELKQRHDVKFTYNSNAIEGNTLTQSETELVLKNGITIGGKTLNEHLEVIGHKGAIDYIETLSQSGTAVGEWEIRQIHSLIVRAIAPEEAGCYRQLDVQAAGTEYRYPPHYQLNDLMQAFSEWLNSNSAKENHPVLYAAEAHLRFVTIHPFRDGNGRTGRLLMNLLLLQAGYPIVTISNQVRKGYIDAIATQQHHFNSVLEVDPVGAERPQDQPLKQTLELVIDATRRAFVETLEVVATARSSRGQGLAFYTDLLAFLEQQEEPDESTAS
jgi:Fic family protein